MYNTYEEFKKFQVTDVKTLEEFLAKHTKYDRHFGRGEEYVKARTKSYREDIEKDGFTFMSKHESVTGQIVSFYPIEA